ncbi:hypothetical protein LCGC14_2654620 [marine sediment metagenome]|uniref:Peptidase MA-like domain-containing protein n=1 Tax=marine sediment metagenome TaxID=412755 RepID=A0A0F8ZTP3_9ZZZZ
MAKTTQKHFETFKAECEKWVERYGLKDWRIHYFHKEALDGCMASYSAKILDRVASMFLNPDWKKTTITDYDLKQSAFHEVSHLFFSRIWMLAMDRFACERDIDEEIHVFIRTLENVLWHENKS